MGVTLWDMRRKADIPEETGELPVEVQLRQRWLQWLSHACAKDARPPTSEASAEMPPTKEADKARWNTAEVD